MTWRTWWQRLALRWFMVRVVLSSWARVIWCGVVGHRIHFDIDQKYCGRCWRWQDRQTGRWS